MSYPIDSPTRRLCRALLSAMLVLLHAAPALAADLTLVLDEQSPTYTDFVAQLRIANASAHRLTQGRVNTLPVEALASLNIARADSDADSDSVLSGVKTRGMRPSSLPDESVRAAPGASLPPQADPGVLVAVGMRAARALVDRNGNEPLLLALLGRLEYEELRSSAALRRTDRPLGVLLRDPAASYQLSLIDAVLPDRRRVGVVAAPQAAPLMHELKSAARQWPAHHPGRNGAAWVINAGSVADPDRLNTALQAVLPDSDALLILPDPVGTTSAAGLALLQAAAGANLPVFASSDAMVLAGALAALIPNTAQLAQQAQDLGQRLQLMGSGAPLVETPKRFVVHTNPHVARRLGLVLASDDELTNRLSPKE